MIARLVESLAPGGVLRSLDGSWPSKEEGVEGVLGGLIGVDGDSGVDGRLGGMQKPIDIEAGSVPLRLGKRKDQGGAKSTTSAVGTGIEQVPVISGNGVNGNGLNGNGKRESASSTEAAYGNTVSNGVRNGAIAGGRPPGVGFVDFSDDLNEPMEFDDGEDDELIDEDTLLDESDLQRTIVQRMFFFSSPSSALYSTGTAILI